MPPTLAVYAATSKLRTSALKLFQHDFALTPVGHGLLQTPIKARAVIEFEQMAKLMGDNVVNQGQRQLDQFGIERDMAATAAAAPALAHFAQAQRRRFDIGKGEYTERQPLAKQQGRLFAHPGFQLARDHRQIAMVARVDTQRNIIDLHDVEFRGVYFELPRRAEIPQLRTRLDGILDRKST